MYLLAVRKFIKEHLDGNIFVILLKKKYIYEVYIGNIVI